MGRNTQDSGFEDYRRERNKHRLRSAPRRDLGANARVLAEIEQAEIEEARNQKLTREVHDFFSDATRTAAEIVQKVSLDQVHQIEDQLSQEMADFLTETIRRAQEFVSLIQLSTHSEVAETEVVANMQNLVGQTLDQFRNEGTAQLSDKHLGHDPFGDELDGSASADQPDLEPESAGAGELLELNEMEPMIACAPELAMPSEVALESVVAPESQDDPQSSMDDHLVASPGPEPAASVPGSEGWFFGMKDDPDKLKTSLKLLVRSGMMTKDEALVIYRKTLAK